MSFFATCVYLRGNLRVRLATQRKSLRKSNLRLLATTCRSVCPGLKRKPKSKHNNSYFAMKTASSRIKIFPFSCACVYACLCAANSENEIPLLHNTSTRIFTRHGYVWPMKILDPDRLVPKMFGRLACVEFRFLLGHSYCLRLCIRHK